MYVRKVRSPAQRDRALALSRKWFYPAMANGRQPILGSVCGRAAPLPCSVRRSRTPTAQRTAVINIDARNRVFYI